MVAGVLTGDCHFSATHAMNNILCPAAEAAVDWDATMQELWQKMRLEVADQSVESMEQNMTEANTLSLGVKVAFIVMHVQAHAESMCTLPVR